MKTSNTTIHPASGSRADSGRESRFDWPVCYAAEEFLVRRTVDFLSKNSFALDLARRMHDLTGTLLLDWTDHLIVPASDENELRAAGFVADPSGENLDGYVTLHHPDALLPRVLLAPVESTFPTVLTVHVDSVEVFLKTHRLRAEIDGKPLSRFRRAVVASENGTQFVVAERRGYRGFVPDIAMLEPVVRQAGDLWRKRRRTGEEESQGYHHAQSVLEQIIALVGRDLACHVVFEVERDYWQRRNQAAQIQKKRQDALGLGWANHDHHTFRSSRKFFIDLMSILEHLGFERRERFYAGEQAGWGAQILEQPIEGIVVFADVDLLPDETEIDFSRKPLRPAPRLGTVGLWVGLHGESFLDAGMHHLEARFDFATVREQLKAEHIAGMAPFSNFDFLKQAFTEGERWPVRRERAEKLLREGLITPEQFEKFVTEGAIGSHLETLQRRGGFKGFNQKSVSAIISATDPRKEAVISA
jgi:hypothetical protein